MYFDMRRLLVDFQGETCAAHEGDFISNPLNGLSFAQMTAVGPMDRSPSDFRAE